MIVPSPCKCEYQQGCCTCCRTAEFLCELLQLQIKKKKDDILKNHYSNNITTEVNLFHPHNTPPHNSGMTFKVQKGHLLKISNQADKYYFINDNK